MLSDQALIDIAGIIGESGTCDRLQVGAVLTINRRIISTGYNGAPSGMAHCTHGVMDHADIVAVEVIGCDKAVHAEANAIAFAAKNGVATKGSVLYLTHSPCVTCARLLINAGVKEVIYDQAYRDARGIGELAQAGIKVTGPYGPEVRTMSPTPGYLPGVHSSEPPDKRPFSERNSDSFPGNW